MFGGKCLLQVPEKCNEDFPDNTVRVGHIVTVHGTVALEKSCCVSDDLIKTCVGHQVTEHEVVILFSMRKVPGEAATYLVSLLYLTLQQAGFPGRVVHSRCF